MLNELIKVVREKAVFHGDFRLTSGQPSHYYIDLSKVMFVSKDIYLVASVVIDALDGRWTNIDTIGGPAIGSIAIVSSVLTLMGDVNHLLNGFFTRKESKGHGKNDIVEGQLQRGDRVLLVDDVTTTGNSLLKTVEVVQEAGGEVVQVISVLDRNQGAKELFEERKIPFKFLISIEQIIK